MNKDSKIPDEEFLLELEQMSGPDGREGGRVLPRIPNWERNFGPKGALIAGDKDARVYVDRHGRRVFWAREATPNQRVQVFDLPGRGRKPCPHCGKYVHVATQQCRCGLNFNIGD